jgi:endonuclease G
MLTSLRSKKMKTFSFTFSLFTFILYSVSFAQFNFLPKEVPGHQILVYTQFTLSYNETHEQADWVAYELNDDEADMDRDRCDCFRSDQDVTTGSATSSDYSSTGFDRGHLSPAADNNMSDQANRESFLFSNMSPQLPGFNRELWAEPEEWVRDQADDFDTVYVVTGPVFVNNLGTLGNNDVTIPGYFYKTLLRFEDNQVKTIAFLIPQVGAVGDIEDYVVTVNTIETLTGLDFYPALNTSVENRAESQYEPNRWGL